MDQYRYTLTRNWIGGERGSLNFIMLNPSTADDYVDDPTIRRCIGFAKRWGFSELVVTNLFAYRSTNPRHLAVLAAMDPVAAIGKDNDEILREVARQSNMAVCAWGDHGELLDRGMDMRAFLALSERQSYCIRLTKRGNPAHPVREPYTNRPVFFA